jgi:hypothetical protein
MILYYFFIYLNNFSKSCQELKLQLQFHLLSLIIQNPFQTNCHILYRKILLQIQFPEQEIKPYKISPME